MKKITEGIQRRVILTDDPMRAKMLSAHHLEYSTLIYELGDIIVFSGSYNNVPIALASTGFGSGAVLSFLGELKEHGAAEIIYLGGCVSTTDRHGLRAVILADGGDLGMCSRASETARKYEISATIRTVLPPDGAYPEEGCIIDDITGAFYEQACADGVAALSILTVSENAKTGEKMEEHELRSRLYAASRLAFEVFAVS